MAPKRESPSAVPGGGRGGANERGGSLWGTLFECLFSKAFLDAIFEPSDVILEVLGAYFVSLWGTFFFNFWPSRAFFENCASVRTRAQKSGSWGH